MKNLVELKKSALNASQLKQVTGGYPPSVSWDCVDANGHAVIVSTMLPELEDLYSEIDRINSGGGVAIVGCESEPIG